jgi:hypothetical protein
LLTRAGGAIIVSKMKPAEAGRTGKIRNAPANGYPDARHVPVRAPALRMRPTTVIVTTASPGSTYYVYGKGLATLLTKYVGITFSDQATQGPVQNFLLLNQRKDVLALTTIGVALEAWSGADWTKGKQYRAMRAIFPMYDTRFHFAAPKRLNLLSLAAFAGKRIGAGPKAGTGGVYSPRIFKALDIAAVLRNGAFEDLLQQMGSGELDGITLPAGVPITELAFGCGGAARLPAAQTEANCNHQEPSPRADAIFGLVFTTLPSSTRTSPMISSIKLSKPCSSIGKSWKAFIQRRRKPCRPMSTGIPFCRFTRVPCVLPRDRRRHPGSAGQFGSIAARDDK